MDKVAALPDIARRDLFEATASEKNCHSLLEK